MNLENLPGVVRLKVRFEVIIYRILLESILESQLQQHKMSKLNPSEFIHAKVTYSFAKYLCSGRFDEAHAMFSVDMKQKMSVDKLKSTFMEMLAGYVPEEERDSTPPFSLPLESELSLKIETTLEEYPAMVPTDIGWAYCSICGDGCSEAVAATITRETSADLTSRLVIRDIEFGGP